MLAVHDATITGNGSIGVACRPRNLAMRICTKLCVLPPSTRIVSLWWWTVPYTRNFSGAGMPDIAFRLRWGRGSSDSKREEGAREGVGALRGPSEWEK